MTTYPAHGMHLRQPHLKRWLVLGLVAAAALVGVGALAFVDHSSSNGKDLTDAQAITFIRTDKGLPALNAMPKRGSVLPAMERSYAIRMYRSGPYDRNVLNLYYAFGAAATHFMPSTDRREFLAIGRSRLISTFAGSANGAPPKWMTRYGVTMHDVAAATASGMFAGAK